MRHILTAATAAWVAVAAAPLSAAGNAAANDAIRTGPVPSWAERSEPLAVPADAAGLMFIRQQDTIVHLDQAGQQTFVGMRVKLLHPQALQLGNIGIEWNPAVGAPTIHALRIYRDGQPIEIMPVAKFETLRREDRLEQAVLSGTLTAVLKVPDLRVGDELELAYTLPSGDATLRDASSGLMALAATTLPGRYRLGINWERGQEPQIRTTDDFGAPVSRSDNAIDIRVDNPPTITPPKDAPPRFGWQRIVEYSDFATWGAVSAHFAPLFGNAAKLGADSPLRAEAARIAAAHPDPLGRAQAALELVQEQVRYVYVGLDGGNYMPARADETWQRRYGDCKGKSALLLALLGELGVPAEAVLVRQQGSDDGLDLRLPSPGMFDHVVVRATIDGQRYWLDGTLPGVVEMRPRPIAPYRWVLPLTLAGSGLDEIAAQPLELADEMGLFEIDARQGFDKPARKVDRMVKRGLAGVVEYLRLSPLTPAQLTQSLRSEMAGGQEWDTIDSAEYRYDRNTQASILTVTGTGPVEWEKYGQRRELVLPGGGFSPPGRRQRPADQDQTVPFYSEPGFSCYATTVRLPDATDMAHWGFNTVYDTMMYGRVYYRMMERRNSDRTIRMVRGSRIERPEITAAAAQRDNGRVASFDNSKANITYDPAKPMVPYGNLQPVPATFEFDWTRSDAPCLPKDMQARK